MVLTPRQSLMMACELDSEPLKLENFTDRFICSPVIVSGILQAAWHCGRARGLQYLQNFVTTHDIDITQLSLSGSNILHILAVIRCLDRRASILSLISPSYATINARDGAGWTPLLKTLAICRTWDLNYISWLLENGANVSEPVSGGPSTRLEDGTTCLHLLIAAIQPVYMNDSEFYYVGPNDLLARASIPAQAIHINTCPPIDETHVQDWKCLLKMLIEKDADPHAVSKHWGTLTDVVARIGNITMWHDVLKESHVNVEDFLPYDAAIPRTAETRIQHEILDRNQVNRQFIIQKVHDFWKAVDQWSPKFAMKFKNIPLPLGHRSVTAPIRGQRGDPRQFLLRLLSNKCVGQELIPIIFKSYFYGKTRSLLGLSEFLEALGPRYRNEDEFYLVINILKPKNEFIKSYSDGGTFKLRVEALSEFVHMCQAKSTGAWTVERDRARRTDRTRVRLCDESLSKFLRVLTETIARFQWSDEDMGWDGVEDLYPVGRVPGQWVEEVCGKVSVKRLPCFAYLRIE